MSNKVLITNSQKAVKVPSGLRILIRRACNAVLEYEHFDDPAEISVTFVDNASIAELNNQYRWVTFYIDDDADVITQIDSYVDEENCGSVCLSLVRRMVNIIDESYPDIMRTIWGS